MTAKEYLSQALIIERLLNTRRRLLSKLRAQSTSLSAPAVSDKVRASRHSDMGTVDKIIDLEHEIMEHDKALIERQEEILDRIQLVGNPTLIAVLTDKYINGMSIEKIAEVMNKSVRTICVWHGQALQIFRQETGLK